MDAEKELEEINKEIRDTELKELQYKHRLKREQAKAAYQKRRTSPEYKARTHRLCDKGGTVEHFYPGTKDLTAEEFFFFYASLHRQPQGIRGSRSHPSTTCGEG